MPEINEAEIVEFDIKWINGPPIVAIEDREEFETLCLQFMRSTRKWKTPLPARGAQAEKWNTRIISGILIARQALTWANSRWAAGNQSFSAYMLRGKPIGLMVTSEKQRRGVIYINFLTTHPGSENGGSILVEHAVNLSERAGYDGRVELETLNWASTAAYTALGFVEIADRDGKMKLVPSESDRWVKVGQEWRLTKHQDRRTFAGPAGRSEPLRME
jgi:hypothetical protein